ncbi:hypothetical protein FRACYDRAFT_221528 [Fragilariopsis cylindrus CCMP1102]|uniref:peptidylprolyl isomerase n=1 Tax=Fragilariopsis cylindrus CCMP1102 TaxID=635003 RepID=A0A1E7ELT8_9STRA|nr:hypothetical protein FRACYDRAFT_221528 [Fragilariopsis cylindrus CCMP1102]|eukprot:OEU06899.1 hypothetical protein FRACYDRAFT_221528 [Fragilariopsis cylindrus CCMP1102]
MHLKALRRDDSILFDTREEGQPILYQLGSIQEELYYFNTNTISKGRITLGVQDAILAPGIASWEGGYGSTGTSMKLGGIRNVVVPSELAYGSNGVSRYEAYKLKLKQPVAKNEILRYEIELFRCNDNYKITDNGNAKNSDNWNHYRGTTAPSFTARACCPEELYPCQTPSSSSS